MLKLLAVGHKTAVEEQYTVLASPLPEERYWEGFHAYCDGLLIADLHDRYEIQGWRAANREEADAETAAYLVRMEVRFA